MNILQKILRVRAVTQNRPNTLVAAYSSGVAPLLDGGGQHEAISMTGFLKKFTDAFVRLFGKSPQWIHYVQVIVSFAAGLAAPLIAGFAPELLPIAGPIIAEVQTDLAALSTLAGDGTVSGVSDIVTRLQTNLNELLAAGHVKDASVQAKITLVLSELGVLAGLLPKA